MVPVVLEKIFAYPPQIGKLLFLERHAGPDSGMNKGVVTDFDHIFAGTQKLDMAGGNQAREDFCDLLEARF
jgi:hypothetical protein